MELLEKNLRKLNKEDQKLRSDLTRIITELEEIAQQKPKLILDEATLATQTFEDRDKAYREQKANPPKLSSEEQKIVSFYESLGDDQQSNIIKARLKPFYRKALAQSQQSQKALQPQIKAGTIVLSYQTDKEKGSYVCITVSPQNRNQKGGVIETLVDAVTLGIESLLDQGEQLILEEQGKFLQVKLPNKDSKDIYEELNELDPEEFDKANIAYTCILADATPDQAFEEQSLIANASADDPTIIYGKNAAKENNIDISTIRRAVKSGDLEPKYVVVSGRGGRPRLYVTRTSFEKFLEKKKSKQNGTGNT